METSNTYRIETPPQAKIYPPSDPRLKILNDPYTQTIKEFAIAMIMAGYTYEDNNELILMAQQATDKLIERRGIR
ncbi:MAG: hypothetical protein AAF298_00230 [Cyanobacteria bacterium P01_A01_bin.40]